MSHREQQVWNDVQRFWTETAEEPAGEGRAAAFPRNLSQRERADAPDWAVAELWAAIFLVLFGAIAAGLVLCFATFLGWALWRSWPKVTRSGVPSPDLPVSGEVVPRRSADKPRRRRLRRRGEADR